MKAGEPVDAQAKLDIREEMSKTLQKIKNSSLQPEFQKGAIETSLALLEAHPWLANSDSVKPTNSSAATTSDPFFSMALILCQPALIDAFISHGASVLKRDYASRNPLMVLMQRKVIEDESMREPLAFRLIEMGARCDLTDGLGHSLAYLDQPISDKLFQAFVDKGAPLTVMDGGMSKVSRMLSAAYIANAKGNMDDLPEFKTAESKATERLHQCAMRIEAGADLSEYGSALRSHPFTEVLEHNDVDMANLMVAHGANPRDLNSNGQTFLHTLRLGNVGVRWLVEQGVDIDAKDHFGRTPLSTRMEGRREWQEKESSEFIALMTAGASLDADNGEGAASKTPREWIEENGADLPDLVNAMRSLVARKMAHQMLDEMCLENPSFFKMPR